MRISLVLLAMLLAALALPETHAHDFTIVALGDSTTARRPGVEKVYAERLDSLLTAQGIDARIVNAGVPRHTTVDGRERFEEEVLAFDPAIVIIQFGINDSFVDVDRGADAPRVAKKIFEENIEYFATTLKAAGIELILMTPNPLYWTGALRNRFGKAPYDGEERYGLNRFNAEYAASVRRIAAERGLRLIDVYQHYVDRDSDATQSAEDLLLDGMHPNDRGHTITATLLADQISSLQNAIISVPLLDLSGQSWRREIVDSLPEGDPALAVAVDPPGNEKQVSLAYDSEDFDRLLWVESSDQGVSWSTLSEAPAVLTGEGHVLARAADGRYVVAFLDRFRGSKTFGDYLIWVGTWHDMMKGSSGQYRARLLDAIPGGTDFVEIHLKALPDGALCLSTNCILRGDSQAANINVRFTLDEIDWAADRREPISMLGHSGKIRLACVGDAITYGQGLRNKRRYAFPVQLEKMLGVKWEVRNFGVPETTVLKRGKKPFENETALNQALSWKPDVVVCSFGIADAYEQNWEHSAEFVADYRSLVKRFYSLPYSPSIWICDLPPLFPGHRHHEQLRPNWNALRAMIWDVARVERLPIIDLFTPLSDRSELFVSGLYPNAGGASLLAGAVYTALTGRRSITGDKLPEEITPLRPPSGDRAVFVAGATAPGAYSSWYQRKDYIEGFDQHNLLQADRGVGEGDFHINARIRIREQRRSDAAFFLGTNYFGFEGSRETLFVKGPIFGGTHLLDPTTTAFKSGSWIVFDVVRRGRTLQFLIDGNVIHTVEADAQSYTPIGFSPGRSVMQVDHFSLTGSSVPADPPPPRGYSIPIVDLSSDAQRQIVVDREEGQYLGHPTTVLLEDNKTMICVYPKGHGRGAIVMKRSTDAGLTWSKRLPTPESWKTSLEVPTIYRVVDTAGKKRLIIFSGLYPIRMAVSDDDGLSWSELEPIGEFGGIVAMGDVIALTKPGHYMALFHDDGRFLHNSRRTAGRMEVYKTFSHDGGLTWSAPETILSRSDVGLCEPGMIRSPDRKTIAVLMRENYRHRNSHVMFTSDEGKTFTEPRELPGSLTGDRHVLRYAPDGRIVATFRDTTLESPTQGDWVGWVGTWNDIASGGEGQYRIRFMDNTLRSDCAYPGLELLPDGTFVTTTYGHWTKNQKPYIVSVRFKVAELDAAAARLSTEGKK